MASYRHSRLRAASTPALESGQAPNWSRVDSN